MHRCVRRLLLEICFKTRNRKCQDIIWQCFMSYVGYKVENGYNLTQNIIEVFESQLDHIIQACASLLKVSCIYLYNPFFKLREFEVFNIHGICWHFLLRYYEKCCWFNSLQRLWDLFFSFWYQLTSACFRAAFNTAEQQLFRRYAKALSKAVA